MTDATTDQAAKAIDAILDAATKVIVQIGKDRALAVDIGPRIQRLEARLARDGVWQPLDLFDDQDIVAISRALEALTALAYVAQQTHEAGMDEAEFAWNPLTRLGFAATALICQTVLDAWQQTRGGTHA